MIGLVVVTGCVADATLRRDSLASAEARSEVVDPRLAATRVFGRPFSPIVRNVALPYGRLHNAEGLDSHLVDTLKPLDVVLVRSRPALTRLAIPSHFTHAAIWLGTERDIDAAGGFHVDSVRMRRDAIGKGRTVFEAAGASVRLSEIGVLKNTDEILVLRPSSASAAHAKSKYSALFRHLGTPFDFNFDYGDTSRLTCMEVVADVFPEFQVPVRYAVGRHVVVPDDLARRALSGTSGLSVETYIVPNGRGGYRIRSTKDVVLAIAPADGSAEGL